MALPVTLGVGEALPDVVAGTDALLDAVAETDALAEDVAVADDVAVGAPETVELPLALAVPATLSVCEPLTEAAGEVLTEALLLELALVVGKAVDDGVTIADCVIDGLALELREGEGDSELLADNVDVVDGLRLALLVSDCVCRVE